jgi:microcystin-dependent protein
MRGKWSWMKAMAHSKDAAMNADARSRVRSVLLVLMCLAGGSFAVSTTIASCGTVESACAQDECPAGPAGPQGPRGDDGVGPVGTIVAFAGRTAPEGWLLCDGSPIDRTEYAALFDVIGDIYGSGDETSTFNLPDLRGRTGVGAGKGTPPTERQLADTGGAETVTLTAAQMPVHAHQTHLPGNQTDLLITVSGAARGPAPGIPSIPTGQSGGGEPHENMPPFIALNYIIKH